MDCSLCVSFSYFIFTIFFVTSFVNSKLILLMSEYYEDCTKGGAKFADFSGIEFDYVNDTTFYLTGSFKVKKRIEAPWRSYYFIERYDRLQWHRSMIDRRIDDFCAGISNKKEPWYMLTSHLKQKSCPYEAGYEDIFDNEEWQKLNPIVTPNFIGKYRVTFLSYLKDENKKEHTDCMRVGFEIADY